MAVKSVFVFRVGPVGGWSPPRYWYVPVTNEGSAPVVESTSDHEALAEIAASFPGARLESAPELAEAGRALGFRPRAYRPAEVISRAHVAASAGHPGFFTEFGSALAVARFMVSAQHLWHVTPPGLGLLRARVRSDGETLGERISPHGELVYVGLSAMLVFPDRAEADRFVEGMMRVEERSQDPALHKMLVRFVEHPPYAVEAVQQAYGVPRVPVPEVQAEGQRGPLGASECWWMTVLMDALADALESKTRNHHARFEEPGFVAMDTDIEDLEILVADP